MKIIHFKHNDIKKEKYDNFIINSNCASLYAISWYLDLVSPKWELLCDDEYKYVMPLPVKQKFGIKYITQPNYCQQLGIFSSEKITEEIINNFIKSIPYKKYYLQLNSCNNLDIKGFKYRKNFILDLSKNYNSIKSKYSTNCKRNIKNAKSHNLELKNIGTNEFIDFIKKECELSIILKTENLIRNIITKSSAELNNNFTFGASQANSEELLAAVFMPKFQNRIYYLIPVSSSKGKKLNAMSFIIDKIIEENSNKPLILDFEGSEIENIARFFKSFGSKSTNYPTIKRKAFRVCNFNL